MTNDQNLKKMAKQVGPIKLTGTVAGITFYKMGDEFYARAKGGPTREKVLKDKNSIRTRENASEFAHCSHVAKTLTRGIQLLSKSQMPVYRKLLPLLLSLKQFDNTSERGKRNLLSALEHYRARKELRTFIHSHGLGCRFSSCTIIVLFDVTYHQSLEVNLEKGTTLFLPLVKPKKRQGNKPLVYRYAILLADTKKDCLVLRKQQKAFTVPL